MPHSLAAIADFLNGLKMDCTIEGDAGRTVVGVATLEQAAPDEISFLANPKYEPLLQRTLAGAVIVSKTQEAPPGLALLRVPEPYAALTAVMVHVHGYRQHRLLGISDRAVIDSTAEIGENASIHHGVTIEAGAQIGRNAVIYPGCYVSANCRIGDDCVLYPNVVIYEGCKLGHRVTIHAGSVIGEDGLGYARHEGRWHKIPQVGIVEIEDDVEIGANCTIDRATLGKTVIAAGSKFSNLIAIGHGTKIGRNCMLVAQVGLAGSVTVGNDVTMAGKVGVAGHLSIGDGAEIAALSGVMRDVPPGARMLGQPARPLKEAMRSISLVEKLPELHRQIRQLEARLEAMEKEPK